MPQTDYVSYVTAHRYLGKRPTQGKCDPCGRFYYFGGKLARQDCPICRIPLRRSSGQSTLPRYLITLDHKDRPITEAIDDLVRDVRVASTRGVDKGA